MDTPSERLRQERRGGVSSGATMHLALTYLPNDPNHQDSGPLLIRVIGDDNAMFVFMSLWSPHPAGLVPPPSDAAGIRPGFSSVGEPDGRLVRALAPV
jgi:hypothetical protein